MKQIKRYTYNLERGTPSIAPQVLTFLVTILGVVACAVSVLVFLYQ